jgi:predicted NUDIX family NTP pyrophosphohydrolase
MPVESAGLMMYRKRKGRYEILLVHPGGPFFKNKNQGAWSIPKGVYEGDEAPLDAAKREFEEELGFPPQVRQPIELGQIRQKGGKRVTAWAFEGDCDPDKIVSNTFTMEWPPDSGKFPAFPEIDQAAWFDLEAARHRINPRQLPFIDRLESHLQKS